MQIYSESSMRWTMPWVEAGGPSSNMAKRIFDLVLASAALLLLSPLLGLIAVAVKLDSPGPVFYRQERVGRGGRTFRIHKFRSMVQGGAPLGPQITVGADPRITRVGALLRGRKLDELAQLFDVVMGSMSLVGPRPEVPRYVAMYPPALREKVLSVRPGMTDLASIEFRDEGEMLSRAADPEHEYVHVVMPRKLSLAAAYIDRATLASDAELLFRTLRVLFQRRPLP
jgi:lipopolysaccharide/colanic/teichoic acid biosynthesis glycosyltransferase